MKSSILSHPIGTQAAFGKPIYLHLLDKENQIVFSYEDGVLINYLNHKEFRHELSLSIGESHPSNPKLTGYVLHYLDTGRIAYLGLTWDIASVSLVNQHGAYDAQ